MRINPVHPGVRRGELLRWAGWFAMANALVMILVSLRYLEAGHLSSDTVGWLFGIAMFLAHASSVAILFWLPVFAFVLVWPQRHIVVPLASIIGIVAITLLYADTVVYQQYRFHLNSALLSLFFSGASAATFEFSLAMKAQIATILAAIIIGQYLLTHLVWRFITRTREHHHGYGLACALVAVFLATNLFHAYADAAGNISVTRQTRLLPLYEPLTARGFLEKHGFKIEQTPRNRIASVEGAFDYPRVPLQTHNPDNKPNILWIVVDSWRFDTMTPKITPHIAAFAKQNIRFTNHYSGGNATRIGIFTLFYGIPGTYWHSALRTRTRAAMITRLNKLNYHFAIYRSAPLYSPEFNRTVFAGIDNLRMTSDGKSSPARDIDATQDFTRFLKTRESDKPFFGFLFLDSPHAYDLPDDAPMPFQPSWESVNFLTLDEDTNREKFFNLYKNSVHFVDNLIGKTLKQVRAQGLLDDTIIVITGDHGQEFNDTGLGYWGHNGNYSRYQTKVPLIIHWPGKGSGRVEYFTSHFDIAATLMKRVLGVENAFDSTSVGRDLFKSGQRLPIIMAEYRGYGAYTGERFVVFPPFGGIEIRNLEYHPIEGADPSPKVIQEVLRQMRWFRAD